MIWEPEVGTEKRGKVIDFNAVEFVESLMYDLELHLRMKTDDRQNPKDESTNIGIKRTISKIDT